MTKSELLTLIENGELALSHSSLSAFLKSPKNFIRYKTEPRKETPAMVLGTMLHTMILEPDKFCEQFIQIKLEDAPVPSSNWNKKENKEWRQGIIDRLGEDQYIVTQDQVDKAQLMSNALMENPVSGDLLGQMQDVEYHFHSDVEGMLFQGFVDIVSQGFIADIKKVADADPRKLKWKARDFGWHRQAFIYQTALQATDVPFYNICVDESGEVCVTQMSEDQIFMGRTEVLKGIQEFKECALFDNWASSYDFFQKDNGIYIL